MTTGLGWMCQMTTLLVLTIVLSCNSPASAIYCGDKNCYDLLGISNDATLGEVKKAYRKLALKYHPDRNAGDADMAAMFVEMANAYEILGDEQARSDYDYALLHPEETFGNQYRYYRARFRPRIPVSYVLAGLMVVSFIIECTFRHTATERNKRQFRRMSETVGVREFSWFVVVENPWKWKCMLECKLARKVKSPTSQRPKPFNACQQSDT